MKLAESRILQWLNLGDSLAVHDLFPQVYSELRRLAAARMAHERSDHTLQATGLVHEAFVRLLGPNSDASFESIAQFYAAAAEAMRRILIDHARKKSSLKRGGSYERIELTSCEAEATAQVTLDELLDLDELLTKLQDDDPIVAKIVSLRVYAGLSVTEAAKAAGVSRSVGYQLWDYALTWFAAERQSVEPV